MSGTGRDEVDEEAIEEAVSRLREGFDPEAIYLYGSYAYGEPGPDSDVDILVVVSSLDDPVYEAEAKAYGLLAGMAFPAEIHVVTREEFEERRSWVASIEREVDERGIELYAAI